MAHCCKVVRGRAVSEMRVFDHTEAFELLEISIDRRQVDIRRAVLNLGRKLLCGAVPACFDERLNQETPWRRDPVSLGS